MKLFKFSQQWGKTLRETGGGEAQEMVFMLMLMLEVTHFPMAGIGKPFKNYLPFSLKKKSLQKQTGMKNALSLFFLILWLGSLQKEKASQLSRKKKSKQNILFVIS
jgi:hypothetical protein